MKNLTCIFQPPNIVLFNLAVRLSISYRDIETDSDFKSYNDPEKYIHSVLLSDYKKT
jgi:hypothetical protein